MPTRSPGSTTAYEHRLAVEERAVVAAQVGDLVAAVGPCAQLGVRARDAEVVDDEVVVDGAPDADGALGQAAHGRRLAEGAGDGGQRRGPRGRDRAVRPQAAPRLERRPAGRPRGCRTAGSTRGRGPGAGPGARRRRRCRSCCRRRPGPSGRRRRAPRRGARRRAGRRARCRTADRGRSGTRGSGSCTRRGVLGLQDELRAGLIGHAHERSPGLGLPPALRGRRRARGRRL